VIIMAKKKTVKKNKELEELKIVAGIIEGLEKLEKKPTKKSISYWFGTIIGFGIGLVIALGLYRIIEWLITM